MTSDSTQGVTSQRGVLSPKSSRTGAKKVLISVCYTVSCYSRPTESVHPFPSVASYQPKHNHPSASTKGSENNVVSFTFCSAISKVSKNSGFDMEYARFGTEGWRVTFTLGPAHLIAMVSGRSRGAFGIYSTAPRLR